MNERETIEVETIKAREAGGIKKPMEIHPTGFLNFIRGKKDAAALKTKDRRLTMPPAEGRLAHVIDSRPPLPGLDN
ncbi:MAG TPA: hypothetical protein VIL86_11845 [Tepidisphaeraceae bacterium]|jgi:hypothetical protein